MQVKIRDIQHFLYCPHRWGLLNIDCAWAENYYVVKANLLHDNPLLRDDSNINDTIDALKKGIDALYYVENIEQVMGIEGNCAHRYFSIKEVENLINSGVTVNNVNFYVNKNIFTENPNNSYISEYDTKSNANDPAYWESYCCYFGTYNGYKFLYSESSVGVETSFVTPKNVSSTYNYKIESRVSNVKTTYTP
ncbi:MAG: CRISPR-associated endonuclease Cas1 [Oscillospiraceae bacterium]